MHGAREQVIRSDGCLHPDRGKFGAWIAADLILKLDHHSIDLMFSSASRRSPLLQMPLPLQTSSRRRRAAPVRGFAATGDA